MNDGRAPKRGSKITDPRVTEADVWAKVKKAGEDDCWLWQGRISKSKGYGQIMYRKVRYRAHRLIWIFLHGEINPPELEVMHSCDVRKCCNPKHLSLGTHDDNMKDRHQKGRYSTQARGEKNGFAKLSEEQVKRIKTCIANGESDALIGEAFDVSASNIRKIRIGKYWTHVKELS